jgi:hypothetical protein
MSNKSGYLKAGEVAVYKGEKGEILAACEESCERIKKLSQNIHYKVKFSRIRNYDFHKKYFSMLGLAFENQEDYDEFRWFRRNTLLGIGHCDTHIEPDGTLVCEVNSISFAKCNQDEFEEIYQSTLTFLMGRYGFDESFVDMLSSYS